MPSSQHAYRFPWRDGNAFRLLIDGPQFFPVILQAIDAARHCIVVEMYLVESGQLATRFIDAFERAVRRGVQVNVLMDYYGSLGLHENDKQRLRASGVRIAYFNPLHFAGWRRSLYRDHRKIVVVDGAVAFVGGVGLTDEFDAVAPGNPWRETVVEARGPVVADWEALFADAWNASADTAVGVGATAPPAACGTRRGRVVRNQPTGPWEVNRSLYKRIRTAERYAWLATAYFVPSWKLRRAVRAAARNGTDVRLLVPGPHSDHPAVRHAGRRHYGGLLRHGVRIFEYQPRFMHQKVLLCDDWVSIGSCNADRWGQRWNLEANQEIDDQEFAQLIVGMLQNDLAHAKEITRAQWIKRAWYRRMLEWFWGKVDSLLERLGR